MFGSRNYRGEWQNSQQCYEHRAIHLKDCIANFYYGFGFPIFFIRLWGVPYTWNNGTLFFPIVVIWYIHFLQRIMVGKQNVTEPYFSSMVPLLQVFDMPTSLRFYRDILGFTVYQSSGTGDDVDWVLLRYGTIELMLNTAYEKAFRPVAPDENRNSVHSDTTLYFYCSEIDELYLYLSEKGMNIHKPSITVYGWKSVVFFDPDGYELCFHYPMG